ncbi:thioesterase family protein [Saccharomonospora halophila]|uniref:thioesterase family protein n=1 Tax=Saccharomonospora halophila TaxID=129922 RepID=UPI000376A884|nr:thioesterase family protein [Saccharomonospora halophila]
MSTVHDDPAPFPAASDVRSLRDGTFTADLRSEWSIGTHPHGGFLLTLLARAAVAALAERGEPQLEPLTVSAEFLRPPAIGPVLLRTDVRKVGRRTTVVAVTLEQRGRVCVEARVTVGRLPVRPPVWNDAPAMPADPPANAVSLTVERSQGVFHLAQGCEVRLDPATAGYLAGREGDPPRMRLWARPREGGSDAYFSLLACDINPPVVFNLGGAGGWAPTTQLTALVRTRPQPGWLRIQVESRSVQEGWFDSDAVVADARGRIVCQARQLALTALH